MILCKAIATPALSNDIDVLKTLVSSMRVELTAADSLVAHPKQQIALPRRDNYGASAERSQHLAYRPELRLEELELTPAKRVVAERATPATDRVVPSERKRSTRNPFPVHLPRERVVVPRRTRARLVAASGCRSEARTLRRRRR